MASEWGYCNGGGGNLESSNDQFCKIDITIPNRESSESAHRLIGNVDFRSVTPLSSSLIPSRRLHQRSVTAVLGPQLAQMSEMRKAFLKLQRWTNILVKIFIMRCLSICSNLI